MKNHDEWLSVFNKKKAGKIFNLVYDVKRLKSNNQNWNKLSFLCAAISVSSKGTSHEKDAIDLINEVFPEYFETE